MSPFKPKYNLPIVGAARQGMSRNAGRQNMVIPIADSEESILKECLSKYFRTFRYHQKTGSSVGLGLSVVYGLIRDPKGSIKVNSTVGHWTVFTVRLPVIKSEE